MRNNLVKNIEEKTDIIIMMMMTKMKMRMMINIEILIDTFMPIKNFFFPSKIIIFI